MNTELFEKATRLNETLFEQFGKAAEMQMNACRRYADVTMEQAETLKSLSEQFTADWKAWQDYFNESREQIQKVFEKAPEASAKPGPKTAK